MLLRLAASGEFSGAVVIGDTSGIRYMRGFGYADREKRIAFGPATPTDGASLAKPMIAALVLMLVHEGRIELDSPVRRYVPEYPHHTTSVRHLLEHSGGLPDYDAFQTMLDGDKPVGTLNLLDEVRARHPSPTFDPGSAFGYCNLCYDALALLVERVERQPFEAVLRAKIARPLGMSSAFLRPARFADWQGTRTRGYRRTSDGWALNDAFDNEGFYGGGNVYLSALDLHAWTRGWWKNSGPLQSVRSTALGPALDAGSRTGLTLGNWYCDQSATRCHYRGHHQGFHNFGYWDANKRLSIAFVSNSTLPVTLQAHLPRALIRLAEGREPKLPDSAGVSASIAAPFEIEGRYDVPGVGRVMIEKPAQVTLLRVGNGPAYRMFAIGSGPLYVPGLDVYVSPLRQARGIEWLSVYRHATAARKSSDQSSFANKKSAEQEWP